MFMCIICIYTHYRYSYNKPACCKIHVINRITSNTLCTLLHPLNIFCFISYTPTPLNSTLSNPRSTWTTVIINLTESPDSEPCHRAWQWPIMELDTAGASSSSLVVHEDPPSDEDFQFEYPVGACGGPDWCLRVFCKDATNWQWVWAAVHAHVGLGRQPYQWVKENKPAILADFSEVGVPSSELHIGSEHKDYKWGTTLSSRALLVMLLSLAKKQRLASSIKSRAFIMVKDLMALCWAKVGLSIQSVPSSSLAFWARGGWHRIELKWVCPGMTRSLLELAALTPAVRNVWNKLSVEPWHGYRLTSSLDFASVPDLLVFLSWTWAHQFQFQLWLHIGQYWLPEVFFSFGVALDLYAQELSQQKISPIPIILHRGVKPKHLDAVNRLLLLYRMRKKRRRRQDIASTHTDVAPEGLKMVSHEAYYDSIHYCHTVKDSFSNIEHLQVSPFTHIGRLF